MEKVEGELRMESEVACTRRDVHSWQRRLLMCWRECVWSCDSRASNHGELCFLVFLLGLS